MPQHYTASIVIPVYNQSAELEKLLEILQQQTYPKDKFEVIVADNGSTDDTRELVSRYEGVQHLLQDEYLNSSYSSRNRGVEMSKGDVVVLLDGTVLPEKDWLAEGLKCMDKLGADIVTSDVKFDYGEVVTAGKIYDSNNLSTESAVENRGVAKTASLFVKKEVFETIGLFKEGADTAEDVIWTWRASQNGFKIKYCYGSVAHKKAKTFLQSVKKQWRDGKGQPAIWKEQGVEKNAVKKLISNLIPYHPRRLNKLVANKDVEVSLFMKVKLYFVAYVVWVTMSLANVYGSYQLKKEQQS